MAHEIIYALTDAAQQQAARQGHPAAAVQRIALPTELVSEALDLGATVSDAGDVRLSWGVDRDGVSRAYGSGLGLRPGDAVAALSAIRRAQEALAEKARREAAEQLRRAVAGEYVCYPEKALEQLPADHPATVAYREHVAAQEREAADRREAEIVAAVEAGPSAIVATNAWGKRDIKRTKSVHSLLGEPWTWSHHTADPRLQRLHAEAKELAAAQNAAHAAEQEEAEARQRRQIEAWLSEHGVGSQHARWREGLLPEDELRAALRDWALRDMSDFGRYKRINSAEVLAAADEPAYHEEVEFEAGEAEELTDDEYATLQAIRAAAPDGATVTAREHRGGIESADDWAILRRSARVAVTVCGYELSREYALSQA